MEISSSLTEKEEEKVIHDGARESGAKESRDNVVALDKAVFSSIKLAKPVEQGREIAS